MAYAKTGAETRVNVGGQGSQVTPSVATLADGRYAIAWSVSVSSATPGGSITARLFNADGSPASGDIALAASARNGMGVSSIDALAGGGFAVGYFEGNTQVVRVRVVGADGTPGADFAPNPSVMSTQFEPHVLGLANGNILVAWQNLDRGPSDFDYGTSARIFRPDGSAVTDIFQVNVRLEQYQTGARPALLANGDFVIGWSDYNPAADGSQNAARARIFAADGTPRTGEIAVNTTTIGSQTVRDVAALPGGGFIVHYENNQRGSSGQIGSFVQAFDASGARVGDEVPLSGLGGTFTPLPDGSYVHSYSSDALQPEVYLQRYTSAFIADGGVEFANTSLPGAQASSDVDALSSGFVVTYFTGDTTIDGSGTAILMQRFGAGASSGTRGDDVLGAPSGAAWTANGGAGNDDMTGGAGNDRITGGSGNDVVRGGAGDDRLVGGDGNDTLVGGSGRDVLNGGAGDDRLVGGAGQEVMTGGAGADTFAFTASDLTNVQDVIDARIADFTRAAGDRIDVSAIDAMAGGAMAGGANDAFTFIGGGAFSGTAGELRVAVIGGNTYAFGDTDGDTVANLVIRIDGAAGLTAGDFVL